MDPSRLQSIAKRVVQRVLSQASSARSKRSAGVHVEIAPGTGVPRPGDPAVTNGPLRDGSGLILVSAEDLTGYERGSTFLVPAGAHVTSLAQEEASRRGIELSEVASRSDRRLRVAVGADHGGFPIKEEIKTWLQELGHAPIDLGTHSQQAVDYPDFARAVAEAVVDGRADLGVCVDGAGIGSSIAANKVPGARAALCYDEQTAKNAREHNFANILSLGGPMIGAEMCRRVLKSFLATPEGAARHARRVEKIIAIEERYSGSKRPLRRVLKQPGAG
ncbi:MAG: ribose 5-phosphate isomerase B [Planctomycetota bacterium]|jgi:ribose 5-phosphate isomerase B